MPLRCESVARSAAASSRIDHDAFEPIRKPGPGGGWSASSKIRCLTIKVRVQIAFPNRNIIYFQPLGDFAAERSPSPEKLRQFAAAFFAMEISIRRFRSRISRPGAIRSHITRKSLPLMSFAFLKRASPPMPSAFWRLPWKIFIPNLPGTSFLVRRQYAIVLVFIALLATTRHFTAKRAQAAMKSFSSAGAVKSLPTRPATCLA